MYKNSRRKPRKWTMAAVSAGVVMGTAMVTIPSTPAAAAGGSATDWMNKGRFGVMEHWLPEGCPLACDYPNNMPTAQAWKDRVNNYDVNGVVQQLKSTGASWFTISVGQNTGYFSAPNATYDQLVPPTADHPSRLAQRDLIKELGQALHKEGIKLIVYTTSDAMSADQYARHKLGGDGQNAGPPNATYQENWLKVIKTWADQWGTDVDGYWVDGAYYNLEPFYDKMASTLRSGNPNALLSFNKGLNAPLESVTTQSDFTPGETGPSDWPRPTNGRWVDNRGTQMQLHYLGIAQGSWGFPADTPMSFSDEKITEHTLSVNRVGGAVTWDVGYDRSNGRLSEASVTQLKKVGKAVGRLPTELVGAGSNRCVDIPGGDSTDGSGLQLYDCNGTGAQKWTFDPEAREVHALGKCMEVKEGNSSDGTRVQLDTCNGSAAQKWSYDPNSKQLKAYDKCLDAERQGTANETKLILFACHGGTNQQWRLGS